MLVVGLEIVPDVVELNTLAVALGGVGVGVGAAGGAAVGAAADSSGGDGVDRCDIAIRANNNKANVRRIAVERGKKGKEFRHKVLVSVRACTAVLPHVEGT